MTDNSKRQVHRSNLLLLAMLVTTAGIGIYTGLHFLTQWHDSHWHKLTSPLTPARKEKLCKDLGLPENHPKCREDAVVYGPDFYPEVKRRLQPFFGDWATYEEVEELFKGYRSECRRPENDKDGNEYFICYYDLRCDNVFPFAAFFHGNGELMRLSFSTELYDAGPLRINFCLADYATPPPE